MGKEARVKEARAKVMEKLEGGKAREEVCSSAAEMGRGGVAYKRECARLCGWMIFILNRAGQVLNSCKLMKQ